MSHITDCITNKLGGLTQRDLTYFGVLSALALRHGDVQVEDVDVEDDSIQMTQFGRFTAEIRITFQTIENGETISDDVVAAVTGEVSHGFVDLISIEIPADAALAA